MSHIKFATKNGASTQIQQTCRGENGTRENWRNSARKSRNRENRAKDHNFQGKKETESKDADSDLRKKLAEEGRTHCWRKLQSCFLTLMTKTNVENTQDKDRRQLKWANSTITSRPRCRFSSDESRLHPASRARNCINSRRPDLKSPSMKPVTWQGCQIGPCQITRPQNHHAQRSTNTYMFSAD